MKTDRLPNMATLFEGQLNQATGIMNIFKRWAKQALPTKLINVILMELLKMKVGHKKKNKKLQIILS